MQNQENKVPPTYIKAQLPATQQTQKKDNQRLSFFLYTPIAYSPKNLKAFAGLKELFALPL